MKRLLVLTTAILLFRGVSLAQQNPTEKEQTTILKSGESMSTTDVVHPNLPKDCKDYNIAEFPDKPDSIFVCRAAKWIEYVRKDKIVSTSISKEKLALLCAEEETEVPEPKPPTDRK